MLKSDNIYRHVEMNDDYYTTIRRDTTSCFANRRISLTKVTYVVHPSLICQRRVVLFLLRTSEIRIAIYKNSICNVELNIMIM